MNVRDGSIHAPMVESSEALIALFDAEAGLITYLDGAAREALALPAADAAGCPRAALFAPSSLRPVGGEVHVAITDDGPGPPEGARLFEPFSTTKSQGSGLGLALVHRIPC
jgi:signal transduction histidine kinase